MITAALGAAQAIGGAAGGMGGGAPDMSSASSGPANAGGTNSWTVNVSPPSFSKSNWAPALAVTGLAVGAFLLWSNKQ